MHVYTEDLRHAYEADTTAATRLLLHDGKTTAGELAWLGVDTVIAASEFGVSPADELADLLGTEHNDLVLSKARRDKYEMVQALRAAGVPHARTETVTSSEELGKVLDSWGDAYPLIVKPVNSAGSDGCTVCPDRATAEAAYGAITGARNLMGETNHEVIVQQFLKGTQYIVNTVSLHGSHLLTELYAERIDHTDNAPMLRHIISRTENTGRESELVEYVFSCLDALGVREGAAHTEVMLTPDGPRLVEVNSRVMGPCLAPDPYHAAFGYSHQHLTVERFLRPEEFERRFALPYGPSRTVAKVFLRPHREGVLEAVDGLRALRRMPGFHSVAGLPQAGETLRDRYLTTGACGIAFLVHEDAALLESVLESLHEIEDAGDFFRVTSGGA
ncbi:ATP-grasp domain-containing protein [Streptomyces natalensis]|uniref:ATP-grasp domain-containing protein n=1 Tax=Streptomyces natalensis TaxID=68242 RepID=UPI0012FF4638|nr:ATP-grasp domain-containing protein [Streptomyces natalensis]